MMYIITYLYCMLGTANIFVATAGGYFISWIVSKPLGINIDVSGTK